MSVTEIDPQVSSTTSNTIPKWNGTTLVDGVVTDDGTNIGVGVAPSAGNKVDVNGKIRTTNLQMTTGAAANFILQSDATGNATWQNPNLLTWGVLGNTGTVATTNFLGTTDNVDIVFKRNNIRAGFIGNPDITTGNKNTSFGANALNAAGTGNRNTAIGTNVLPLNTSGTRNTAIGNIALSVNTTGSLNTTVGESSMTLNTIGIENTAIGAGSLYSNTDGRYNTALGRNAMTVNASGWYNTASGYAALRSSTGYYNTATGANALYNSTAEGNTAIGVQSSLQNTTGNYNTTIGFQSFNNNASGAYNVAVGHKAGYFETGSNKLYIENSDADANNALVYGEFDTNILRTNGTLQIGNPTTTGYALPTSKGNNGEVLQSNGTGGTAWVAPNSSLSVMRTNLSATQTLSTIGWQLVTFNTVDFDENSEFNTGTSKFVATKTGYYQVNAGYQTNDQANTQLYSIAVFKNASPYQQNSSAHSSIGPVTRNINCIVHLNAGESIEIQAENFQIGVDIDASAFKTYFEVKQLK